MGRFMSIFGCGRQLLQFFDSRPVPAGGLAGSTAWWSTRFAVVRAMMDQAAGSAARSDQERVNRVKKVSGPNHRRMPRAAQGSERRGGRWGSWEEEREGEGGREGLLLGG